jgi:hypothetical protein
VVEVLTTLLVLLRLTPEQAELVQLLEAPLLLTLAVEAVVEALVHLLQLKEAVEQVDLAEL